MNLSDIDVLILCGGKGTRLAPVIGDDIPKCLAPINGKPFIEYLLGYLYAQGAKNIILVASHLADEIQKWRATYKKSSDKAVYVWVTKENNGPLQDAAEIVRERRRTVLVLNGDTLPQGELAASLSAVSNGVVELKLHGKSTGIYYGGSGAFRNDLMEVHQAEILIPFSFIDIGTPEGYAKAQEMLK